MPKSTEPQASCLQVWAGSAPTERMRELVIRDITTEMGIRGALPEAFEAGVIGMEILQGRKQTFHQSMRHWKKKGKAPF